MTEPEKKLITESTPSISPKQEAELRSRFEDLNRGPRETTAIRLWPTPEGDGNPDPDDYEDAC